MQEKSNSTSRVAFALLCGLAVCCSVMYITADGAQEFVAEEKVVVGLKNFGLNQGATAPATVDAPGVSGRDVDDAGHDVGSGQDVFTPESVDSTDVLKTGLLFTRTPDTLKKSPEGRERLLDFLNKVEQNIAKEVSSRKADITRIRAQMAKNMALNEAARSKMKKMLLAKMAANAKQAKDDLAREMRKVQKEFADAAALENKRQSAVFRRAKKTREIMKKNKREGATNLKNAVAAQQRALATLDQATNAKIKQTNAAIGANAAAIKANAKKARESLDNAMNAFDNKMNNMAEEAKKGRSKLVAQAAAQDKKFRADSNNQIKKITADTAAEFSKVRTKMAEDRAHADAELSHTTARLDAALHASAALQDKRFQTTVADIAAAKKEANDRVAAFKTSFKTDLLALSNVVEEQSKKLNARVTQLSGTVASNKADQAHLNSQVNAENKRIQKVGQERYAEHLKKDAELKSLMASNKADTAKQMTDLRTSFTAGLDKIKGQMKKDRASHEAALAKSTGALFSTLTANKKAQDEINGQLTAATHAAELKAKQELTAAKDEFATKIAGLTSTVEKNKAKHTKKVLELTGIVEANALKDAAARTQLKKVQQFNYNAIKNAVADAVHKGEQRALQVEKKMAGVNKKTVEQMNTRITTEIGALAKNLHSQLAQLALDTKEARAQMKKEILEEVDVAKKLAAQNLKAAVAWSEGEFSKLHANLEAEAKLGGDARAAMKAQNDADKLAAEARLNDAVATQAAALLSYRQEMCKEIGINSNIADGMNVDITCGGGKLNKKVATQYEIMIENANAVKATMASNQNDLTAALESARSATENQLAATDAKSAAAYSASIKAVEDGIAAATKRADAKFAGAYIKMAEDAQHHEDALEVAVRGLNEDLATAAALEDRRFAHTVKDIATAKKEASDAVGDAKKMMVAQMISTRKKLDEVEKRITGDIMVVSAMIVSDKAEQSAVNKMNEAEMARIIKKSNEYYSDDKRARGGLKAIIDEHKRIAADETATLAKEATKTIATVEQEQRDLLDGFKKDLTKATEEVYAKLAADNLAQIEAQEALTDMHVSAKAATAAALADAHKTFDSRVTSLTNVITANKAAYEHHLAETTGIVTDWKKGSAADRKAIRAIRDGQVSSLESDIVHAIQIGEAKIKAVEQIAQAGIEESKTMLLSTISSSVENMADAVFATVQGNRGTIADNYLSLKAYSAAAADGLADYLAKGKGRNLSSIGDLLNSIIALVGEDEPLGAGEGFGMDEIPALFSGEMVPVDGSVSKINGLVNEYIDVLAGVKGRWPMGLGYYLISQLEMAMQDAGALEVDEVEGKNGKFVYVNAASVGLASKLPDFQSLAVTMTLFESSLASLTKTVSAAPIVSKKDAAIKVPAPEWQGN
jgi:hypothetical protein